MAFLNKRMKPAGSQSGIGKFMDCGENFGDSGGNFSTHRSFGYVPLFISDFINWGLFPLYIG
jgi:hypothetical protein